MSSVKIYQFERKFDMNLNLKSPNGIKIVKYNKEHARDLMLLWNSNLDMKVTLKELLELNEDGVFIAMLNGQFTGFAVADIIYDVDKNEKIGEILEIIVVKEFRRKGVGSSLLKRIEKYFRSKNVQKVTFSVKNFGDDPATLKLAKKFGFKIIAIRKLKSKDENVDLLKYNYIYKIMKLTCIHCNKKIDFLDVLIQERCPFCDGILSIDPMAS
ncbi:MAG: GNAT family N-acetyltransferase [Candidatus Helarchaeota archaeon]